MLQYERQSRDSMRPRSFAIQHRSRYESRFYHCTLSFRGNELLMRNASRVLGIFSTFIFAFWSRALHRALGHPAMSFKLINGGVVLWHSFRIWLDAINRSITKCVCAPVVPCGIQFTWLRNKAAVFFSTFKLRIVCSNIKIHFLILSRYVTVIFIPSRIYNFPRAVMRFISIR